MACGSHQEGLLWHGLSTGICSGTWNTSSSSSLIENPVISHSFSFLLLCPSSALSWNAFSQRHRQLVWQAQLCPPVASLESVTFSMGQTLTSSHRGQPCSPLPPAPCHGHNTRHISTHCCTTRSLPAWRSQQSQQRKTEEGSTTLAVSAPAACKHPLWVFWYIPHWAFISESCHLLGTGNTGRAQRLLRKEWVIAKTLDCWYWERTSLLAMKTCHATQRNSACADSRNTEITWWICSVRKKRKCLFKKCKSS